MIKSLNPCFNGRYSQSMTLSSITLSMWSLNPCFNGRYSQSGKDDGSFTEGERVLILVLMEDTLREFGLAFKLKCTGLNPCFNGRYSQRHCMV